jgi:hypothetical protein
MNEATSKFVEWAKVAWVELFPMRVWHEVDFCGLGRLCSMTRKALSTYRSHQSAHLVQQICEEVSYGESLLSRNLSKV